MKLFFISWTPRIEHEKNFLKYIQGFLASGNDIYYCFKQPREKVRDEEYPNIHFIEYDEWLSLLRESQSTIIFFEYYSNLSNFDFLWYTVITFGSYISLNHWEEIVDFLHLDILHVFDFFRLELSQNIYRTLFSDVPTIDFQYSINYPSALPQNHEIIKENKYDVYIPLWPAMDNDTLVEIIENNSHLTFLIWPIDHPEIKNAYRKTVISQEGQNVLDTKKKTQTMVDKYAEGVVSVYDYEELQKFNNVQLHYTVSWIEILQYIYTSKIIFLPLRRHLTDLTRIADALSLGKVVICNRIAANDHIQGLMYFEWLEDAQSKLDFVLDNKFYENEKYAKNVRALYKKTHSLDTIILHLFQFLKNNWK